MSAITLGCNYHSEVMRCNTCVYCLWDLLRINCNTTISIYNIERCFSHAIYQILRLYVTRLLSTPFISPPFFALLRCRVKVARSGEASAKLRMSEDKKQIGRAEAMTEEAREERMGRTVQVGEEEEEGQL